MQQSKDLLTSIFPVNTKNKVDVYKRQIQNSVEAAKAAAAGNMIAVRTKLGAEYAALAEEIIQYDDLQGIRGGR